MGFSMFLHYSRLQIPHNIWKFCTKFGQLIHRKSTNLLQPGFEVKMHQIQCRLGLFPRPAGEAYSALQA